MENRINAKFNLTNINTENYVPDLNQFDVSLDARINGARTIRIRIFKLSQRRQARATKPSEENILSPKQALFQAQFGRIIRGLDMMTEGVVAEIPVTAFYPNINVFVPQIIEFARQSADTAVDGHPISGDDWRRLVSACESFEQLPFTFVDAFDIVGILRWCEDHKDQGNFRIDSVPVSKLSTAVEGEYLTRLESILQSIEMANDKVDLPAIIESILQVRANLVLDASVFSSGYALRIGEAVSQITGYKATIDILLWETCETHGRSLYEAVLAENWQQVDDTIAAVDKLTSIPNIAVAFDAWWQLTFLKSRRAVAFAAYLFIGSDTSSSGAVGDDNSLPNLRKLFDALQTENLPIREVSGLISVYQTNDLRPYQQLAGRTTGKDALLDAIKIIDFVAPFGINGEELARDETATFFKEELSAPDIIYHAKLLLNWFLPPLLLSGLSYPEERFWQPFVDSLALINLLSHWKEFGGAFCGVFSRAVDLAYPNHPPILMGHVLNIYPEIVELYRSVPTDTDEMIKVLKELYGPNGEGFKSRLQKSRLHVLAETSVDRIAGDGAKRFLRRCYEQAGFIVTDEFCDQLGIAIWGNRNELINGGSEDEKGLREFEEEYSRIASLLDWKQFEEYVSHEALEFVKEITSKGNQLIDGQKRFVTLPTYVKNILTTDRKRIYKGSNRKLGQYDWYLICRRIVFAMSRRAVDGPTLAPMIGYAKLTPEGKTVPNPSSMRSLLTAIGLGRFFDQDLVRLPEREGGRLKPEEEKWLDKLPPA